MSRLLVSACMVLLWAASSSAQTADPKLLERATALLDSAPLIDTHNDLPTHLLEQLGGDLTRTDLSKIQLSLSADVPRLREGHVGGQYWAVFSESDTMRTHTSLREAIREFDVALRFIRSQPALELARTADDIERIHKSGRIPSLLGVEGGHMIESSSAAIRIFQELGARYLTLTHLEQRRVGGRGHRSRGS